MTPKVSVAVLAFNHERFIAEALDSILCQKVDFDFEIVIHDDASTDSTVDILNKYANNHSNIRLILQSENQFSRGAALYDLILPKCNGEYIAVCEGDDFWGDEHKLAKQVGYLDKNSDVFISGHDARVVNSQGQILSESKLPKANKRDYSGFEMQQGRSWLLTGTWVFRNVEIPKIHERRKVLNGDAFLLVLFGDNGGSHHHDDILPSSYRVHDGGVWSTRSEVDKNLSNLNTAFWCYSYFKRLNNIPLAIYHKNRMFKLALGYTSLSFILRELIIRLTFFRKINSLKAKLLNTLLSLKK